MTLQIGAVAPDFEADTTNGPIHFHDWIGNSWALLFSHPKDFTPVCTTELGALARLQPEFDKRGVRLIGLSVDPVAKHSLWVDDIQKPRALRRPIIRSSAIPTSTSRSCTTCCRRASSGDVGARTAADNQTVRNVFVIGPDKEDQARAGLSDDHRPQLRGDPARDRSRCS